MSGVVDAQRARGGNVAKKLTPATGRIQFAADNSHSNGDALLCSLEMPSRERIAPARVAQQTIVKDCGMQAGEHHERLKGRGVLVVEDEVLVALDYCQSLAVPEPRSWARSARCMTR